MKLKLFPKIVIGLGVIGGIMFGLSKLDLKSMLPQPTVSPPAKIVETEAVAPAPQSEAVVVQPPAQAQAAPQPVAPAPQAAPTPQPTPAPAQQGRDAGLDALLGGSK